MRVVALLGLSHRVVSFNRRNAGVVVVGVVSLDGSPG